MPDEPMDRSEAHRRRVSTVVGPNGVRHEASDAIVLGAMVRAILDTPPRNSLLGVASDGPDR